jgi:serine/threonine-protein phosphatase 2B regulatory subunit
MFRVYDFNNDGFISNGDLYKSLKVMVGNNLEDLQLQQLVDRTILQADADKDGKLSFEEFLGAVSKIDFEGKISINL